MVRLVISLALFIAVLAGSAFCSPAGTVKSEASVSIRPTKVLCPLEGTLFGVNVNTGDKANMAKPEFIERVKKMGIKSCRFPNGCEADLYDWKNPKPNQATVQEFLDFCDSIGAEPYYTINLQGGTEDFAGPPAEGIDLDERIRYRHVAPNPCGYTNYYYGTLAETLELVRKYTVERALAGKRPILHYEMGNENWGQSRTDWPPEVYSRTIEVYAKAMRGVLDEAAKAHPELAKLKLYIVAVGYPVMGSNMKMVDSPDRTINIFWTGHLNRLYELKLIDAVQEHYYPYASANGGALAWALHNLGNIIAVRKNLPNPRLAGYRDPAIAYEMPMEHTEWNVKCWGPPFSEGIQPTNPGFEDGLAGWTVNGQTAGTQGRAARRGTRGLAVAVGQGGKPCEVSQVFDRPEKARTFVAGVWVRTENPAAVKVSFRQANEGAHKGEVLGSWSAKLAGMWERVVASGKMLDETRQVELVLSVDQPASVYFDEARLYYTTEERGQCPISATTFEQELFCVDALRAMALGGCPRAHLHHLAGNYPCGAMTGKGETKDLGRVFEFFAGAYGNRIVEANCSSESFGYYSAGNPWATDFNALAPDRPDIPALGCMASRQGNLLYLLLINRTSDRSISVAIDLGAEPAGDSASVRTLSGTDIDLPGANLSENRVKVARRFTQVVEPYSAQIITVRLAQ